jgi:uncharacterized protein YfaS (alpha-2-macroglobulin family)
MVYQQGDTFYVKCQHKTYDFSSDAWSLANPDSGYPKITIIDSAGTTKVNAVSMTKVAVGKYEYSYQIESDASTGTWVGYIQTANSEKLDEQHFAFDVE